VMVFGGSGPVGGAAAVLAAQAGALVHIVGRDAARADAPGRQHGELAGCNVFEGYRLFLQGIKMALVPGPIGIADSLDEQCSPIHP